MGIDYGRRPSDGDRLYPYPRFLVVILIIASYRDRAIRRFSSTKGQANERRRRSLSRTAERRWRRGEPDTRGSLRWGLMKEP